MADVYIYDAETDDFSTIGMCGKLTPISCEFEEEANGMSELTLEHPIDANGRFMLFVPGRLLKATVPVREVPEIDDNSQLVTTIEVWNVRSDATKLERTVYNKRDDQVEADQAALRAEQEAERQAAEAAGETYDSSGDQKALRKLEKKCVKVLKKKQKVHIVKEYGELIPEYRVRASGVTGYINKDALENKVERTYPGILALTVSELTTFYEQDFAPWRAKEQMFRIYSVTRSGDKVVVNARHIFYDMNFTTTRLDATGRHSPQWMMNNAKANKIGSCPFAFHTNITGTRLGAHYRDQNLVSVLLDPDTGIASRWDADLVRDNYDVYIVDEAGHDRGTVLEYAHDLTGVEYNVDWESVVTAIRPVGQRKNGKPLYLVGNKGLVKSTRIDNYPHARVATLQVSEAKVSDDVTTADARTIMKTAARAQFAAGIDQPKIGIKVNFVQLGNTVEYAQYKELKQLFLFDTVRVRDTRLGINTQAKVVRIKWDCVRDRLTDIELGSVRDYTSKVSSFQISSVNGSKLTSGSVDASALGDGSVSADHLQVGSVNADAIQANAITADHIVAGAVTTPKIDAGAVTAEKLDANAVNTKLLTAMNAVIQNIDAGHATVATLDAAFADLQVLEAGSAMFDRATVQHLVAQALNLTFGVGQDVFISNLRVAYAQMVSAAIGNLCIKASDGNFYLLDVNQATGAVTATQTTVTPEEEAAGETTAHKTILDTDITAASLSTATLLATYGLVNKLDAARINVDTLIARQAFIDTLATREIVGERAIRMIAGQSRQVASIASDARIFREEPTPPYDVGDLWVVGDEVYICQTAKGIGGDYDDDDWIVSNAYDAAVGTIRQEVGAIVEVDTDGLHVKGAMIEDGEQRPTGNEVHIDSSGMNVKLNGDTYSQFKSDYAQFGNYQVRRTADGGLAFKLT